MFIDLDESLPVRIAPGSIFKISQNFFQKFLLLLEANLLLEHRMSEGFFGRFVASNPRLQFFCNFIRWLYLGTVCFNSIGIAYTFCNAAKNSKYNVFLEVFHKGHENVNYMAYIYFE